MNSVFQKFTTHSKNALKNAFSLALTSGHKEITPFHILYGLVQEKGSIAAQILYDSKILGEELKETLATQLNTTQKITNIDLSHQSKKILEKSFLIASIAKHKYIGTEHLLASLVTNGDEAIINLFEQKKIDLLDIKKQIDTILNSTSKFPDLTEGINFLEPENKYPDPLAGIPQTNTRQASALDLFATDLTDIKIQKNIDPVIGREEEIARLIQILARRNKNNPMLLGDPGVGKTAIIEGLAKKIIQGEVPEVLNNKKIYSLDISLVLAGTSFRGEFENRLKQILAEVKQNPDIILFIDEIHNIIGAGSATGSMDAANILKPALARGEIRCIGATTPDDYRKHIENDAALERRFQTINVMQPSVEKTIEILNGVKENYEIFHNIQINEGAIHSAALLSERYITDRFLPDKAIDLIDEASSASKIKNINNDIFKKFKELEENLRTTISKKEEAVAKEKFSLAIKYRQEEKKIKQQIEDFKETEVNKKQKFPISIDQKDIAEIVAKITGIPLTDLLTAEKNLLLNLEKLLAKKIIGQDEVLKTVASFVRRARTGITASNRPTGSFIFLGSSGVGKTELAKVLAESVFGSAQNLIKIDMSEFAEGFNISKLIGAPAGYIGYKDGTKLTDMVKKRPYSVILFDEIEKAHPQIFSLMLQVLEDGYLTDATGKQINFRNTIIIMTSNLGSESFNQQAKLGFQSATKDKVVENLAEIQRDVIKKLKNKFPPEFLSRVDKTIVFNPLTAIDLVKITKLHLKELEERLAKQGLKIKFDSKIAKIIAEASYSPEVGARAIRKNIQEMLENKIATRILSNKKPETMLAVKVGNNKIII